MGGNQFVIADSEKDRQVAEGHELMLMKSGQASSKYLEMLALGCVLAIVFVEVRHGAVVAEMPVERRAVSCALRAAMAGITMSPQLRESPETANFQVPAERAAGSERRVAQQGRSE